MNRTTTAFRLGFRGGMALAMILGGTGILLIAAATRSGWLVSMAGLNLATGLVGLGKHKRSVAR